MIISPNSNSNTIKTITLSNSSPQTTIYQKLSTHPTWIQTIKASTNIALYLPNESAPLFTSLSVLKQELNAFKTKALNDGLHGAQLYSSLSEFLAKYDQNSAAAAKELIELINIIPCDNISLFTDFFLNFDLESLQFVNDRTILHERVDSTSNIATQKSSSFNSVSNLKSFTINNLQGSFSHYTCTICLNSFLINQSTLFKAINGSKLTCDSCKTEGFFRKSYGKPTCEKLIQNNLSPNQCFEIEFLSSDYISFKNKALQTEIHHSFCFDSLLIICSTDCNINNIPVLNSLIRKSSSAYQFICKPDKQSKPNSDESNTNYEKINNSSKLKQNDRSINDLKNISSEIKKNFKTKNKQKTSINHLLNFTLTPRAQPPQNTYVKRVPRRDNFIHFDREAFVLANFRFMLNYGQVNEKIYTHSDFKLNWDEIIQVIVSSSETLQCPICLEAPTASRITRCGHVFCHICILRFFSENIKEKHLCPVCSFGIDDKDLKPVILCENHNQINKLDKIQYAEMRLMRRDLDSIISLPANSFYWHLKENLKGSPIIPLIPWSDSGSDILTFAKIMWCSRSSLQKSIHQEILDLNHFVAHNSLDSKTKIFADAALKKAIDNLDLSNNLPNMPENIISLSKPKKKIANINLHSFANSNISDVIKDILPISEIDESTAFFFYQSSDGQHIYLNPLDLRIIKEANSDSGGLPNLINVQMQHFEQVTETVEYRKRVKIYSHVPLRCDITIIECNLSLNVPVKTLNQFEKQLKSRENRHKQQIKKSQADDAKMALAAKLNHQKNQLSAQAHPNHPIHSQIDTFNDIGAEIESSYYADEFSLYDNTLMDLVPVFGVQALKSEFPELKKNANEFLQNSKQLCADNFDEHENIIQSHTLVSNNQNDDLYAPSLIKNNRSNSPSYSQKYQKSTQNLGLSAWENGNYKKIVQNAPKSMSGQFYPELANTKNSNFVDMSEVWAHIDKISTNDNNISKAKKKKKAFTKISLTGNLNTPRR
ncbi:hypothetical protein BB561_005036 [Smittium simulii]|uniref:RING-type domain-containing protein n=1 Tax=Smittium simulii TaxID=133385 RepID=A0A2T9YCM3_9FUNG|nr:hypothetical protein BB561_005036 [Smittium simulii]